MANLHEGWGWPGNSRKAHWFKMGESTSICGRWLYTGQRFPDQFKSQDDCSACRRWFDGHQQPARAEEASGE